MSGQIKACTQIIQSKIGERKPKIAIILGSGLGQFADTIADAVTIPYSDLPGFPHAGVSGHAGQLLIGNIGDSTVMVLQGRAHYYESGSADAMKVAVRCIADLGCETLLLTNAAGSLNPDAGPGSIMLLTDHISFTGVSPLFGEPDDSRFVDLSDAYDIDIQNQLKTRADTMGITLHEGVYMWFCGPHFETPAEIRAAGILGANAVGMSTVPEVILARHAGLKVAAMSIITNLAAGMSETKLSHSQTMENAAKAAKDVCNLLTSYLSNPN
ncbi:MAG: purine-nucleoside phosphorylase [Gammaproteobacteria bacterium]|nr:purine-nucleoside phosphorylase [Gammaproteobacteria bacterium]